MELKEKKNLQKKIRKLLQEANQYKESSVFSGPTINVNEDVKRQKTFFRNLASTTIEINESSQTEINKVPVQNNLENVSFAASSILLSENNNSSIKLTLEEEKELFVKNNLEREKFPFAGSSILLPENNSSIRLTLEEEKELSIKKKFEKQLKKMDDILFDKITKRYLFMLLASYHLKFHGSKVKVELNGIISLLQSFQPILEKKITITSYFLEKIVDSSLLKNETFFFCEICGAILKDLKSLECENCHLKSLKPPTAVYFDIEFQIQAISSKIYSKDDWNCSVDAKTSGSIQMSQSYLQKQRKYGKFRSYSFWIDGAAPTEVSTKKTIWFCLLKDNELNGKISSKYYNLIIAGIYSGVNKPNINCFLQPIIIQLKKLFLGIPIQLFDEEKKRIYFEMEKILIFPFIADSVARADLLGICHHNSSEGGCHMCDQKPKLVEGKKHYQYSSIYSGKEYLPETLKTNNIDKQKNNCILLELKYVVLETDIPEEVMHLFDLGVVNKIITTFFKDHKELDQTIKQQKALSVLEKSFRGENTGKKKAIERRYDCLYLTPIYYHYASDLVGKQILNLNKWMFLNYKQNQLQTQTISDFDLLATNINILQGKLNVNQLINSNFHHLEHVGSSIHNCGSLLSYQAYNFEGSHGYFLKSIHGTSCDLDQITWNIKLSMILAQQEELAFSFKSDWPQGFKLFKQWSHNLSLSSNNEIKLGSEEIILIENLPLFFNTLKDSFTSFSICKKIWKGNFRFCRESAIGKKNDSTVTIAGGRFGIIKQIFIVKTLQNKVPFVQIQILEEDPWIYNTEQMKKIKKTEKLEIIPFNDVLNVVVLLNFAEKLFICLILN